ncbi:hypothetical protein Sdia_24060 [Streptomyces diastaticus subsp. diastaticus]|uniref:Translation initiation factor IF-2 n=1 Tax=Streptomyces diastaticus subsp. diastaticus TaxID=68040 RepID=A0ABQ1CNB8_STRDI|nr:hypothetical protein [Streptomyces diastaticus]GFH71638.1 hypothetical protein Sdia_24060 [Streptomyces diastaticus subsp. diastaticus]GGU13698.1 hypothetical protein GCM10015534_15610 [Streptomyces diastaticus subsp. diastaticus]
MSDETDDTGQVLPFRPTRGTPPPPPPPPPPPHPPMLSEPPASMPVVIDEDEPPPTLVLPTLSVPEPAAPPPPVPALPALSTPEPPAVLRSEGHGEVEAAGEGGRGRDGLGGVMVAAIGIAVAALRGMTQWAEDRRQRFQDQAPVRLAAAKAKAERIKDRAEHDAALAAIGNDAAKARAKGRVQSPTEFGRDATKNKGGKGSKGTFGESGSSGSGRAPKPGQGKGKGGSGGKDTTAHGSTGAGGKPGAGGKGKGSDKGPKGADGAGGKSPSLERARGRQERAADKQRAKDQRRADRAAAQLEDWGKGRDRRHGSQDDRQAVKDRIRNGRLEAKAARKDAARDARRQERAKRKEEKAARDRTTLGQSLGQSITEEAERRLKDRRDALDPPVLSRNRKNTPAEDAESGPKVDLTKKPRAPKGSSTAPPKATSPKPPPPGSETAAEPPKQEAGGPTGSGPGSRSRRNREQQPPPRQEPRADGEEWLRPPPGMRVEYTVTIDRPDREAQAQARARAKAEEELRRRARLANVVTPNPGLPPGPTAGSETPPGSPTPPPSTSSSTSSPAPKTERKAPIPMPGGPPARPAPPPSSVGDTQFTDSDLTVYDVIDADQDMAEEITAGAEHALLVADRCQRLQAALEGLRASLIAKSVPGVFVGWCTRLIERAGVVEDKAVAVARGLPRASEAIAHAGAVAAEHDKPVADVVRDMGHTAPAAASYHQE